MRFILIAFLLLSVSLNGMADVSVKQITSSVFCPCGCDRMLVSDCNCGTADEIKEFVSGRVNDGAGEEKIIEELKIKYGEQIIPISPESGFGLAAWAVSVLAFFAGVSIVVLALKTWISGKNEQEKEFKVSSEDLEKYKNRIESGLEKYK